MLTPSLNVENTPDTPSGTEMAPSSSMASSVASPQGHTPAQSSQGSVGLMAPIEELKPRGKGQYLCPEGLSCTKGGVQADGTLVVFERNSAFRLAVPFRIAVFVRVICSKNHPQGLEKRQRMLIGSRAHLEKHEKRYRCDIPGCNNKTGFARIDQLERHKRMVKHQRTSSSVSS